ncbi:unnamed protein product [Peronospora farinosa]|uniref:Calponin-homology (CH) domain-containing protein n=1 Tax=Peronospora farinosa TaxID=134698 RepID=A0AAV0SPS3_9STRA|nr:unnamed protein product [Peronospora farinosa]CAI5705229.1 unnamed protein product [Peronospora farinosa]
MESNSDVLATNHGNNMSKWAMDGMHRRRLSLLEKWDSDKLMAIGYLRRQREIITWIESVLKCELSSICLFEVLKSGVVLREMMEVCFPDTSNCMQPINRNYSKQMAPWKERENISVFLRLCKSIGMNGLSLFCTDDLYEGTDMVQVLFCLEHFKMILEDHTAHYSKCVCTNEPAEFSNQELEMSRTKQDVVNVTASRRLLSFGRSSVLPTSIADNEKESVTREASELDFVLSKGKKNETVEPAKVSDEKVIDEVLTEVCNHASEDKPNVENPADGDNMSFRQNGSDVSNEQAIQAVDTFVLVQNTKVNLPLVHLGTEAKNEKAVARLLAKHDVSTTIEKEFETPMDEVAIAVEETIRGTTTDPATDLVVDMKAENDDQVNCKSEVPAAGLVPKGTDESENQTNIDNEVTAGTDIPVTGPDDASVESTLAEDIASAQSSAENVAEDVAEQEDATSQPTEEELLDAKTMAKCSCGTCTIM